MDAGRHRHGRRRGMLESGEFYPGLRLPPVDGEAGDILYLLFQVQFQPRHPALYLPSPALCPGQDEGKVLLSGGQGHAVDRAMPSEEMAETRAVVKALAYGYQDEIPSETEETFRRSGAIHLLALSGMHLGLLYGVLTHLLAFAGNSPAVRRARSVLIILVLWAFTIFTGCGVSILRAAVMFSIYEAGALLGRARNGVDSMALSAIIITVADPDAPSGLSFQLSYAAMTAIFLIYPHIRAIVPTRGKVLGNIVDVCAMTVACQITTAPIIYLHFGTFAFFSLLANLLCTPLVSIAMALIPAALAAPWLGEGAAAAAAGVLSAVIKIFIDINDVISHL